MAKGRIVWIDVLKAFGIILVMLGHIYQADDVLYYWIYSFHVPLFFFLSGIFFVKADSFKGFLVRRWNSLLLPYLFFYLITFLYWVFIERNARSEAGGVIAEWWRPVGGAFLGVSENNLMPHNNPLWFIPTLFSIEILAFISRKFSNQEKALFACVCSAVFVWCRCFKLVLPWEFVLALQGYLYYWLGNALFNIFKSRYKIPLLIGTIIIYITALYINGGFAKTYTFPNSYNMNEMVGYLIVAIASIIICMLVCASIFKQTTMISRLLQFYGTNTLLILCVHDPVKRVLIFLYSRVLGLSIETVRGDMFHSLIVLVVLIVCMIPLILLYNRWARPLLNKLTI